MRPRRPTSTASSARGSSRPVSNEVMRGELSDAARRDLVVGLLALKYTEAALAAALEGPAVALDAEAQDARLAVLTDVVPVSDGYIPFRDNVDHAARALTPISHQAACRVTECHFVSIRYVHFLDVLLDTGCAGRALAAHARQGCEFC